MPQLSIVVPTFNELGNVAELRDRLDAALVGIDWELIFVDDDSPDGTAERVAAMAHQDPRVRRLLRIGRRGLASACIEGMLASTAPLVAVLDADLQHDERKLPAMIECLQDPAVDVVVGSRYVERGSVGAWGAARTRISRLATRLSRLVLRAQLHDPMSGFFMVRRPAVESAVRAGTSGIGFKVLLDLLAAAPTPLRVVELPYTFRTRHAGQSKLDSRVAWEFGLMLLDRLFGHTVPIRFIAFSIVGTIGLAVHFLALGLLYRGLQLDFVTAQALAAGLAMTGNFVLNNALTYSDQRLRGLAALRGWLSFAAVCGAGALANVGIAGYLFAHRTGWALSAFAGVLVGAVWNYAVSAVYTWRPQPRRPPPVNRPEPASGEMSARP